MKRIVTRLCEARNTSYDEDRKQYMSTVLQDGRCLVSIYVVITGRKS